MRSETSQVRLRVHPDQKRALERMADERRTTVVALIRDAVTAITGVPDTLPRYRVRNGYPRANDSGSES